LQVTKDENDYFNNKKIYNKDANDGNVYKRQIPEYFRILEKPCKIKFHVLTMHYRKLEILGRLSS
jgi:hypothetical protein